jgi:hypothetical protein
MEQKGEISRQSELELEHDLKILKHGFVCNIQRLVKWEVQARFGHVQENVSDASRLVENSLDKATIRWEGPYPTTPLTYADITAQLRIQAARLMRLYIERVVGRLVLDSYQSGLTAREFNATLIRIENYVAERAHWLLEEADLNLNTGLNSLETQMALREHLNNVTFGFKREDTSELYTREFTEPKSGTPKAKLDTGRGHADSGYSSLERTTVDASSPPKVPSGTPGGTDHSSGPSPKDIIDDFLAANDLTNDQLIERAGIDRTVYYKIKKGNGAGSKMLRKLAGKIGCDWRHLKRRTD